MKKLLNNRVANAIILVVNLVAALITIFSFFQNMLSSVLAAIFLRFLYKGIIIKHNKTEPTYTKTSLFLCEKRRFFMGRTEKGGKVF